MIDQLTIDKIMSAAKIEEVVGEYVSLHRRGVNLKGLCPFHSEKTPSFVVSPSKGICHCFGCGKGGNPVNFIMEIEQVNYYEALKMLAKKYGIEVEERELTDEQKAQRSEREALFAANEFARDYFADILTNNAEGRSVGLTYFRERGINLLLRPYAQVIALLQDRSLLLIPADGHLLAGRASRCAYGRSCV